MALQDTPPLADPTTGRIPPYTQVLKQDPVTGTYKIKYDVKAAPPASALQTGLTTPVTTLPGQMYGTGTGTGTQDGEDTDTDTDAGVTVNQQGVAGGRDQGGVYDFQREQRGGGGIGFGGASVTNQSIADLSSTLNPSGVESFLTGTIISAAPTLLGGLIAAGSADQQRQAIKEINRRAAAGTLGTNPDGSQVSDQALASLGQQIGNKYGLPGFTSALNNTAAGQIFAANLAPQSLTGEETFNVTNQMINPVSQEQITRDFDQAMMLGFQENQEQNLRDIFAQDISRQTIDPQTPTNIAAGIAAEDEAKGVQTGDAAVAEAEAQAGSGANYGWNSTDGSTMTSNSTTTNADGTTTTNPSGLQTASQIVNEGTGGSGNYSQNQVNNAQAQVNGAVKTGGADYGLPDGVKAVGTGYNPNTGNYSGTVSYSGGTVTNDPSKNKKLQDMKARQNRGKEGKDSRKIVCTMMNETYGFGSFRNKIWLRYAKDNLSDEHQVGYHKLFLPLVNYAKGNKLSNLIVKKILEHIARHRTLDIRQEMKNSKRHTLGRVYRNILEPLCYVVGKKEIKNGKR